LLNCDEPLARGRDIVAEIRSQSNTMFHPEVVEAFRAVASREHFWFDGMYRNPGAVLRRQWDRDLEACGHTTLWETANLLSRVIDFRSRFTATHSKGVASVAVKLGEIVGFDTRKRGALQIAGLVHDLGKLAVPVELLEKADGLTAAEYNLVKIHPYLTRQVLSRLDGLSEISGWAASHHERLDGTGYPFHLTANRLPLESRVLAVADVATALGEDRPYRKGMPASAATRTMQRLGDNGKLDTHIVELANRNYDEINHARKAAQAPIQEEYAEFAISSIFPAFQ
jgi:HD-GYP domain-containing protein (c-di-GMP phosphodiesterase class II)